MHTRRLLTWIVVLIFASFACQAVSTVADKTEPTASPLPPSTVAATIPPTETAIAVEPTIMQPASPTVTPTRDTGSIPVILSVELRQETSGNEMTVYQDISFQDADGDAYFLDYELISATADDLVVHDGSIKTSPKEQMSGAKITGTWDCGSGNYEAELRVVVADKRGNKSEPSVYTLVCGLGDMPGGFPDLFDDNRNGWGVSEMFFIEDGVLRFRDTPMDASYWVYCENCIVTPEQNTVSVEAWWSNSEDSSLGLLIDQDTCTPDGLVFIFGPHGYYSILQAVRDSSGEWRHWRPFIDWTKSSKILKAQNQPNLITGEYEFGGEELHVKLYINGSYIMRVEVFGYNGAKQCRPGLFSDSGLHANFDNFSIPASK